MMFARISLKTVLKAVARGVYGGAFVVGFNDIFAWVIGVDVHLMQKMTLLGLLIGCILIVPLGVRQILKASPAADRTEVLVVRLTQTAAYAASILLLLAR